LRRDPRAFLKDVVDAADAISHFLNGAGRSQYEASDLLRSAVERKFEIIGEALNQLAKHSPDIVDRISDWRDIVAFRNILAHGYATIDQDLVWRAQEDSLPILRAEAAALLNALDP
jgi:uncharacterized protein with HEPN domain